MYQKRILPYFIIPSTFSPQVSSPLERSGQTEGQSSTPPVNLGCDFFERIGEKRIDIRRFLGYVCHIAKVRVRKSFGWVSLFAQKFVFFDFFVRMRI